MGPLTAAVLLIGALCLFNLLLTFGVIRRLREPGGMPALARRPAPPPEAIAAVGTAPDAFRARALDGSTVTRDDLTQWTIVAFFSPDCPPCVAKVPEFAEAARKLGDAAHERIAVLVGDPDAAAPMAAQLEPVARVVVEPANGPLATAFRVRQMPVMCLLDPGGVVASVGYDLDGLITPAAAPA